MKKNIWNESNGAQGVYKITEEFEQALCEYTGAPFAIALDSCSHAIFLSLKYQNINGVIIKIPNRTFPSVPCEIIHAGGRVEFYKVTGSYLKGAYQLKPTKVWDAALSFTNKMYKKDTHMCLSFTGPSKHLKLIKGGAILTDDEGAYEWFKRARISGRREKSFFDDSFDMIGWNFYMMPEIATRGLMLLRQFYDKDRNPINLPDIENEYPDLSIAPAFKDHNNG